MSQGVTSREAEIILQRSRSNPAASLIAAKNGSHLDLSALCEIASHLPPKVTREVFTFFCSKLASSSSTSQVASGSSGKYTVPEHDKRVFRDASCSLVGIAKIACTQLADPSGKAYYMPLITKSWPKIIDCSAYVLTTLMDAVASSPERDDPPTDTNIPGFKGIVFANIAGLYLSVFHFPEALARERRSSEIVAKIWAHTEPRDPNAAISSRALKMHCFALGRDCSQALDCLIQECGKRVDRVAELAKERLVISLKRTTIDYEEVEANVEVILMLSDDERRSFRASFLKIKGIGAATDGFLALAKESKPTSEKKMLAVEVCTSFYYHMLLSEVGLPWIIQAARNGFLEVIARFSKDYTGDPKVRLTVDNIKHLFGLFVPCHLVFFSVIGAVATGLNRGGRLLSGLSAPSCQVKKEWELFCSIALERIIRKHINESIWAVERKEVAVICSNCSKVEKKNTFRRCSGCLGAMYCSKECQVDAWKNKNHNIQCKYLAGANDIAPLRHKDDKLLMIMACQEVVRHMPGLRKTAERDFPGVPRTSLGYVIDYTTVPMKFGHFRLDDNVEGEGPNQSRARPELRQMALTSGGKAALVSLRLLQGTGCQERDVMVEVKDEPTAVFPVRFRRVVGQDMRMGKPLETRSDVVDFVLCGLGMKDPVSWLSESATPVKHLCDRIDRLIKAEDTVLPAPFVLAVRPPTSSEVS